MANESFEKRTDVVHTNNANDVKTDDSSMADQGTHNTVWKYQDFSVIQILREIDFGESM